MKRVDMTNKEILQKAIEKAKKNGFDIETEYLVQQTINPHFKNSRPFVEIRLKNGLHYTGGVEEVIFNHDFAKAFWGEKENMYVCEQIHYEEPTHKFSCAYKLWAYHLMLM